MQSPLCACGNLRRLGQRSCLDCHARYMRTFRPKHSQLSQEARLKANCRAAANVYLKRGVIKRAKCWICGETAQMHHEDYRYPLLVVWLCKTHHDEHHRFNGSFPSNAFAPITVKRIGKRARQLRQKFGVQVTVI